MKVEGISWKLASPQPSLLEGISAFNAMVISSKYFGEKSTLKPHTFLPWSNSKPANLNIVCFQLQSIWNLYFVYTILYLLLDLPQLCSSQHHRFLMVSCFFLWLSGSTEHLNELHLVPIHHQLHSLHDVLGHSLRCGCAAWRWAALAAARGRPGRHIADAAGVDPFHGQSQVQHTWQPQGETASWRTKLQGWQSLGSIGIILACLKEPGSFNRIMTILSVINHHIMTIISIVSDP